MGKNIKLKKVIKDPLVTIYITNHNYGKYINKAIRSVLNQSLKEFEYKDDGFGEPIEPGLPIPGEPDWPSDPNDPFDPWPGDDDTIIWDED